MDAPSAPAAPDPYAVAAAQGAANSRAANQTTALNRPDQITPYGTMRWKQTPAATTFDQAGFDNATKAYESSRATGATIPPPEFNSGDRSAIGGAFASGLGGAVSAAGVAPNRADFTTGGGDPQWTSTVELDPRIQRVLDAQLGQNQQLMDASSGALSAATRGMAAPVDYASLPAAGNYSASREAASSRLPPLAAAPNFAQDRLGAPTDFTDNNSYIGRDDMAPVRGAINSQKATAENTSNLVNNQTYKLRDLYNKDFNYDGAPAAPQINNNTRQRVEDAMYQRATSRLDPKFQQGEGALRSDLMNRGITEGSQAFNDSLGNFGRDRNDAYSSASNDAIVGGRQAMESEFGLGMQARQQGVSEANTIRQMPTQEALAANGMLGQQISGLNGFFGAENAQNQTMLASQGLQASQDLARLQSTENSLLSRDGATRANLLAQDNSFLARDAANRANMASADASATNSFNTDNAARQNALAEQERRRAQLLNEYTALRTGAQVQNPTFASGQSGASVAAAPIAQSIQNQYQAQMGQYQADVGSNNSFMSGLMQLGGAALPLAFSDVRLKRNIQRVGEHISGLPLYIYNYVWGERAVGVMAHEVQARFPDAVMTHPSGFLMVDYSKLEV